MRTEATYALALSRLKGLSLSNAQVLYRHAGSAEAVIEGRLLPDELSPDARQRLLDALDNSGEAVEWAVREEEFCKEKHISVLTPSDARYPALLNECDDAPLVLFYRGTANLNSLHSVAVVGTRRITDYGKDLCASFCAELKRLVPDAVVYSGLAYGVDVNVHRNCLAHGLETIAVLAHGLDRIYPPLHRPTAVSMLTQGGLLTEFPCGIRPLKGNFVRRNRIVAGATAATIVVESAQRGGALITARLAQDYNRSVFAFPGRVGDKYSEGCNRLVRDNVAQLITSAKDFALAMNWIEERADEPVQRQLFPELTEEELRVVALLKEDERKQINQIVVEADLPVAQVSALLFDLELKGVVRPVGGGRYRLLM